MQLAVWEKKRELRSSKGAVWHMEEDNWKEDHCYMGSRIGSRKARSFEVPARTMEEALNVVLKPIHQKLDAIHWTLDDIKEVANKLAERQDKFEEAMAAFGPLLNVVVLKVEDLLKKFEDAMPPKPKL